MRSEPSQPEADERAPEFATKQLKQLKQLAILGNLT